MGLIADEWRGFERAVLDANENAKQAKAAGLAWVHLVIDRRPTGPRTELKGAFSHKKALAIFNLSVAKDDEDDRACAAAQKAAGQKAAGQKAAGL